MFRMLFYPTPRFRQDKKLYEDSRGPLDQLEDNLEKLGIKLRWRYTVGYLDPSEVKDDLEGAIIQNVNKMLSEKYGAIRISNGTIEFHIAPQAVMDDLRRLLGQGAEIEPSEVDEIPMQEGTHYEL